MDSELRVVGIVLSLCGNVLFAVGFGDVIGTVNDLAASDSGSIAGVLLHLARPLSMLGVGYVLLRLAPRFGGGSLGVQFFLIGVTSMWGAVHASDGVERFVGATIGGAFLLASIIGLVGIAMAYGWKRSLTHGGPV